MSDPFGYTKEDNAFWGDPPLPEKIDIANPGISPYFARADHTHSLFFSEFVILNLQGGWASLGFGYRAPGIRRIGNLVICRGLITGGPVGSSTVAPISADYTPSLNETFSQDSQTGATRVDVTSGGLIICTAHAALGNYVSLSGMIWAVD